MAKLKTIRNGELYLMKDGSAHRLVSASLSSSTDLTGFITGTTWKLAYAATDLYTRSGNHFLSHDYDASSSLVLNLTHPIVRPVFHVVGSTIHMWYGYDGTGGTGYLIYYVNSTDGGATWGTPAVAIALGTGGSWNDVAVTPCGVHYVDANTTYLFVAGNDGSAFKIGRYTIDTSGGTLSTEYATAVNYSQYGSNPITGSVSSGTSVMLYAEGKYHLWTQNSGTATAIYHHESKDGITWNVNQAVALTGRIALRAGINTTLDDTSIRLGGAVYHEGWYYLLYIGNDGSTSRAMVAMGRSPRRLVKCGNIETLAEYARAPFAADLTHTIPDQHIHIPDRNRPGVLTDQTFQPMDVSFTFKFEGLSADGVYNSAADGESGQIFNLILKANPGVRESTGFASTKSSFNMLYRLDSDAVGTKDDFYLFLDCHPLTTQIAEQDSGTTVTATIRCYGANMPLTGRY